MIYSSSFYLSPNYVESMLCFSKLFFTHRQLVFNRGDSFPIYMRLVFVRFCSLHIVDPGLKDDRALCYQIDFYLLARCLVEMTLIREANFLLKPRLATIQVI